MCKKAAALSRAEPVSDGEEELPIPDAASFVFLHSPEVNPADAYTQLGPEPRTNPLRDTSNLGGGPPESHEAGSILSNRKAGGTWYLRSSQIIRQHSPTSWAPKPKWSTTG